jgi:uncharacterized protein YggE
VELFKPAQDQKIVSSLDHVMKKFTLVSPIALIISLFLSIPAGANTQLDVTGIGIVSVAPDEVMIRAQVSQVDDDAGKAQALSSKTVDSILDAIQSFAIKPGSLNTTEFALVPEYQWDRVSNQQLFSGFRATRTVSFAITEIDRLGEALSALAQAGVTTISPPVMGSSRAAAAKGEALAKAVAVAHKKLGILVQAADMSLSEIVQISEVGPFSPGQQPSVLRAEVALDSGSSNTFVPGNLTFVAEVRVQAKAE